MARTIADQLDAEMATILVERLRSPDDGGIPIGAVSECGYASLGATADALDLGEDDIRKEIAARLESLRRRGRIYLPSHAPGDLTGRSVIVVDDGIATGLTMTAALRDLRARRPRDLIVAVAAAAPTRLRRVAQGADEVVSLVAPDDFVAISHFFSDFSPVTDLEAASLVNRERSLAPVRGPIAEAS